jgi:hypothetical protein
MPSRSRFSIFFLPFSRAFFVYISFSFSTGRCDSGASRGWCFRRCQGVRLSSREARFRFSISFSNSRVSSQGVHSPTSVLSTFQTMWTVTPCIVKHRFQKHLHGREKLALRSHFLNNGFNGVANGIDTTSNTTNCRQIMSSLES